MSFLIITERKEQFLIIFLNTGGGLKLLPILDSAFSDIVFINKWAIKVFSDERILFESIASKEWLKNVLCI